MINEFGTFQQGLFLSIFGDLPSEERERMRSTIIAMQKAMYG